MNDDINIVRPVFRVLYGIVFILCVFILFFSLIIIARMWQYDILNRWGLLRWCSFIGGRIICVGGFAYFSFIIALSGKPPKYFMKYLDKYKKRK